ncbi:hypothetical protein ScPMuIL_018941 [Solemya velum]
MEDSIPLVTDASARRKRPAMRLLRKPRAPKVLPPLPVTPAPPPKLQPCYDDSTFNSDNELNDGMQICQQESAHSPTPSVVTSLASPPPSSSQQARRAFLFRLYGSAHSNMSYLSNDQDKKYILDRRYRGRTTMGSFTNSNSLVKPYSDRGPEPFPLRLPRRNPDILPMDMFDDLRFYDPPAFRLENFMMHLSAIEEIPLQSVREIMHSKHNYKKLTKLLAEHYIYPVRQLAIHMKHITPEEQNIPPVEPRVPQRQLLIEMAAMIKEHVRGFVSSDVKSIIRPMRKFSPSYGDNSAPHTEIVLFEDDAADVVSRDAQLKQGTEMPGHDAIFHSATTHYFQGSGRSQSPFNVPDENVISPSEMAILDSLVNGGRALSLKAHFISTLPDITPLMKSITYLNLSFNDFTMLPPEILEIQQLEILKLRNNPLRELPLDIHRLKKLRTLIVSFCLISSLPIGLFTLERLQHLDVSYNRISFLPNEVGKLRNLQALNVDGNQLPALPCGALHLNLMYLGVRNNFMHPLFWKENTQNEPQRLIDVAARVMYISGLHKMKGLPSSVGQVLNSLTTCDCCHGVLYGPGMRIIRPVSHIFGVKNLPFLFRACSSSCLSSFKKSKETLSEILYGREESMEIGEE